MLAPGDDGAPRAAARRAVRALAAAPAPVTQVHAVGGLLHWLAFAAGGLTVRATPANTTNATAAVETLAPDALQLDALRASALRCAAPCAGPGAAGDGAAGGRVAGGRGASWRSPCRSRAPTRRAPWPTASRSRRCAPPTPCTAAAGLALRNGTLYLALERAAGIVVVALALPPDDARAPRVVRAAPLPGVGAGARVSSMTLDPLTGALFVVAHAPSSPSVIYKLNATSLAPYGQAALGSRGGTTEVAEAVVAAPASRALYVLTRVRAQALIVTLLLYAVTGVAPPLADAAGGTRVRVRGEGFVPGLRCRFGPGPPVPATVLGHGLLLCTTPGSNASGCAGEEVEVARSDLHVTDNRVTLLRVPTPTLTAVAPGRGYYRAAQAVVVRGYGFVASAVVACEFRGGGGGAGGGRAGERHGRELHGDAVPAAGAGPAAAQSELSRSVHGWAGTWCRLVRRVVDILTPHWACCA